MRGSGVVRGLVVGLLLGTLAVAGCAKPPAGGPPVPAATGPAATGPAASPGASGAPAVPAALSFTAPLVGGGSFDAAKLAGKPAVFWFWASWCSRCKAKADDVLALHERYAGQVHVVGVAGLGSGAQGMAQFVADHGLSGLDHLADDAGAVWRHFGVTQQEYFVLLDSAGMIVHKGPLSTADLDTRVAALAG